MRKGNLIKMAAPAILSAAMMVSGLPVMAADFTSDIAVETEAQTDEFDAADDTADAFAGDEETPFVDDQTAAEDEFAATAETGYKYVYAGLTWAQYWASEGVYNAANTASNGTKDSHDELDKGGFKAAVEKAEALKEADYTADSWKAMQLELQEAKDLLAKEKPTQAEVDEATTHLNAAVEALVKADTKVTVTLNKKTATVYKGKTTTLKATVTGTAAAKVTFTSSNPKVAAVNKTTGKVTAKAKGTAVITAKCGDVKVTCKVTVKNPTLTLNKTSASVKVGKTTKITAKAAPSGKVTYKSGNKKIATVSSNGTIKGIKKGTAKITVTCNGVTKTVKVTVK